MIRNLSKKNLIFLISLAFFVSLTLYYSNVDYYFFQDDFFEINISKAENVRDYLNFFKFRDDIIAYRPVSLQNYFFLSKTIFGLNPIGFRLMTFILFFASGLLIVKVISQITSNIKIGLLTATLWLTSPIHFMTLTWIAAAYNIIGTFFWLLTSLLFLNYLKSKKIAFYVLAFISFLITIGSYEFSITWPAIFGLYYFFILKKRLFESIKLFSPFISLTLLYLTLRLFLIKVPSIAEYHVAFNLESVKAFIWYLLWTLNIPEEFKKQVSSFLFLFNQKFISEFWPLVLKTFAGAFLTVLIGIALPLFKMLKRKAAPASGFLLFSLVWFTVGISPVLLLPNHTFSMYLTLASIGLYSLIGYLMVKFSNPFLVIILFLIWFATSFTTISFYRINSWMIEAQRTTREANFNLKRAFPSLPNYSVVYYPLNSHWQRQALAQNHSIQVFYNDQTLTIYYNKEVLKDDYLNNRLKGPVYVYLPI